MKKTVGIGSEDPRKRVSWPRAPGTQGLKRVDIPDVCQQRLKRIPIELLPPHKFNKVGIQLGPARPTLPLVPLLGPTPHGLWWHAFVDPQSECCGSPSNAGIPCCQWYYRRPISQKRRWFPAKQNCCSIGSSVAASLCGTATRKLCLVSTSIPPNTHWVFTILPTLAFSLTNADSSISTVWPGPPIRSGCLMKDSAKMSLT